MGHSRTSLHGSFEVVLLQAGCPLWSPPNVTALKANTVEQ